MSARTTVLLARAILATAILAALLLARWPFGGTHSVGAQPAPTVTINLPMVGPGEKVTVRGAGWPAGVQLAAQLYDASDIGGPGAPMGGVLQVDQAGTFAFQGTVPLTLFGQGSRGNLNVVPGNYVVVISAPNGASASVPLTVGAPAQGTLLWGQVYFDTNNSDAIDAGDTPAGTLVGISVTAQTGGAPALERPSPLIITDAKGRYMVNSMAPGAYAIDVSTQRYNSDWAGATSTVVQVGQSTRADILLRPAPPKVPPERYFQETGFAIQDDAFWDYFIHRGGIRTLGYPISRTFSFQGYPTQFFQRVVLQEVPGEGVRRLNLLDPGLMPYTTINGSQFPGIDPSVKSATPVVGSTDYDDRVIDFVHQNAPNQFNGNRVGFFDAFAGTVTSSDAFPEGNHQELVPLLNLEIWGTPTSKPMPDPRNSGFVYLRFQRGILHFQGYDAGGSPVTEGILLGDWFKSLITGKNLPSDLEAEARAGNSPYLRAYDPSKPNWVTDPSRLPDTDLTMAFERQ